MDWFSIVLGVTGWPTYGKGKTRPWMWVAPTNRLEPGWNKKGKKGVSLLFLPSSPWPWTSVSRLSAQTLQLLSGLVGLQWAQASNFWVNPQPAPLHSCAPTLQAAAVCLAGIYLKSVAQVSPNWCSCLFSMELLLYWFRNQLNIFSSEFSVLIHWPLGLSIHQYQTDPYF